MTETGSVCGESLFQITSGILDQDWRFTKQENAGMKVVHVFGM